MDVHVSHLRKNLELVPIHSYRAWEGLFVLRLVLRRRRWPFLKYQRIQTFPTRNETSTSFLEVDMLDSQQRTFPPKNATNESVGGVPKCKKPVKQANCFTGFENKRRGGDSLLPHVSFAAHLRLPLFLRAFTVRQVPEWYFRPIRNSGQSRWRATKPPQTHK